MIHQPDSILEAVRGRLIVSCQAREGAPLRHVPSIVRIAQAAIGGGAAAVRLNSPQDVSAANDAVDVPIIGLWKDDSLRGESNVFITPTVERALALVDAGADIVAADGTTRERPNGESFTDLVAAVHERGALVMADAATVDDGIAAERAGADCVGTTLSGYTTQTSGRTSGPDLELISTLRSAIGIPVIAEGRLHSPADVASAFEHGCWSAVVGTAITDPSWITATFAAAAPQE